MVVRVVNVDFREDSSVGGIGNDDVCEGNRRSDLSLERMIDEAI